MIDPCPPTQYGNNTGVPRESSADDRALDRKHRWRLHTILPGMTIEINGATAPEIDDALRGGGYMVSPSGSRIMVAHIVLIECLG